MKGDSVSSHKSQDACKTQERIKNHRHAPFRYCCHLLFQPCYFQYFALLLEAGDDPNWKIAGLGHSNRSLGTTLAACVSLRFAIEGLGSVRRMTVPLNYHHRHPHAMMTWQAPWRFQFAAPGFGDCHQSRTLPCCSDTSLGCFQFPPPWGELG